MKNFFSYAAVACMLLLQSCLKNNNTTPALCAIRFVNTSPDAPALDVYYAGAAAAQSISFGNANAQYYTAPAGNATLQVSPAGQTDYKINTSISLQPGDFSIYFINNYSSIGAVVALDDFINFPTGDSVLVRFFHFSPNLALTNAKLFNAADSITYSSRMFNDQVNNAAYSNFQYLKAGTFSMSYSPVGSPVPIKTINNITLTGGKVYTLYAKGLAGGSGAQDLDVGILQHN